MVASSALPERQQVRPAEDRVERRAQLVRQRGQELVLHPVDGLGVSRARPVPRSKSASRSRSIRTRSMISARSAAVGRRELARARAHALLELVARALQRLGLALERLALGEELDEDRDLRLQDLRRERLEEVVDGADRVAAEHVQVAPVVRRQEDDRRVARALALADERGRLVAVEVRAWRRRGG